MRPTKISDVVGQEHLVGPEGSFRQFLEAQQLTSMILWGPAGTGKTTLARILASSAGYVTETLSAVSSGVKDVREAVERARQRLGERGERTVLFIDEVHRFNKSQQDLLLPVTESGEIVLIGATTENPFFELNAALMSRTSLWRLLPLTNENLTTLVQRGSALRSVTIDNEVTSALVGSADGDARSALTTLDTAVILARADHREEVTLEDVKRARDGRLFHQSQDSHYDQTSAFIKSIRGSDPDAALFWLVALLESGETPRFLARRLVIAASEDIGLAEPTALLTAEACARAVEFVGLPECRLILAHATLALALAPKSNSVTTGLAAAVEAVRGSGALEVPPHLRDGHYAGAKALGAGTHYLFPHDFSKHWVAQQYLPNGIAPGSIYTPGSEGREAQTVLSWRETRAQDSGAS